MTRLFLIGSRHEESGLTSVAALVGALEHLNPEVIFLERPVTLNEEQRTNGFKSTLESSSVELYESYHEVQLVPVDLPTPDLDFFRNNGYLLSRIERASSEYCRLIDWHAQYAGRYGFPYLNSRHCDKLWNDLEVEIEATVLSLNEPTLTDLLLKWNQLIEQRDIAMVSNIAEYCENNAFERGVFIVGASHRRSIKKKVLNLKCSDSSKVVWDFMEGVDDKTSPEAT